MKRYLIAFGLVIVNLGLLPVTLMHSAEGHAASQFYSKTWGINVSPKYLMDDSFPLFAWQDVKSGAAKWSNRVNGRAPNFVADGAARLSGPFTPCAGPNAVFHAYMAPSNGFPDGVLGFTPTCRTRANINGFTMATNSRYAYAFGSSAPGPGQVDLRSIVTHEFGHATGWYGHFGAGAAICQRYRQTMCARYYTGTSGWRSLGDHDKHTLRYAYD